MEQSHSCRESRSAQNHDKKDMAWKVYKRHLDNIPHPLDEGYTSSLQYLPVWPYILDIFLSHYSWV